MSASSLPTGGTAREGVAAVVRVLVRQPLLALCFFGGAVALVALPVISFWLVYVLESMLFISLGGIVSLVLVGAMVVPLIALAVNSVRVARGEGVLPIREAFSVKKNQFGPCIGWGALFLEGGRTVAVVLFFVFALLSPVVAAVVTFVYSVILAGVMTAGLGSTLNGPNPGFKVTRRTFVAGMAVGAGPLILFMAAGWIAVYSIYSVIFLASIKSVVIGLLVAAGMVVVSYPLMFFAVAVLAVVADNSGVHAPALEDVPLGEVSAGGTVESAGEPTVPADEASSDSAS